jgi:hypothetical protein
VFEPVGQRAAARGVAHDEVAPARHHANPGYRQIADAPTGAPQPAAVARPDREEQLVVVAAAERGASQSVPAAACQARASSESGSAPASISTPTPMRAPAGAVRPPARR